jgi:hypothetical protein
MRRLRQDCSAKSAHEERFLVALRDCVAKALARNDKEKTKATDGGRKPAATNGVSKKAYRGLRSNTNGRGSLRNDTVKQKKRQNQIHRQQQ